MWYVRNTYFVGELMASLLFWLIEFSQFGTKKNRLGSEERYIKKAWKAWEKNSKGDSRNIKWVIPQSYGYQ